LADLEAEGLLVGTKEHNHAVGHRYRCDSIIEPRVSTQWFVKMEPLAKRALEVVKNGQIQITPKRWEKVYYNWLENIRDWTISRQIWWGHRIPAYYAEDGTVVVDQVTQDFRSAVLVLSLAINLVVFVTYLILMSTTKYDTALISALLPR